MQILPGFSYLIPGGPDTVPELRALLAAQGLVTENDPDIYVREYAQFKIADARELRERAELRSMDGRGRVFIVTSATFFPDAQNALLKTLEEPRAGATFFFIVPSPLSLLPTLRSRMQTLTVAPSGTASSARGFLAASVEERLELLKPLYTHDEDEERDVRGATELLQSIEAALAKRLADPAVRDGMRAVYRARRYLSDKGALLKPLLEQVALLTPRM
jgi:DNA polymerase III delta prime subunit